MAKKITLVEKPIIPVVHICPNCKGTGRYKKTITGIINVETGEKFIVLNKYCDCPIGFKLERENNVCSK